MAGRKPIFNREEQRKNQVVVPLSEQEKNQIKEAAKETDRSMASFGIICQNGAERAFYEGGRVIAYTRICMRNLGNHRRGNPLADRLCHFPQEVK